MKRRLLPFLSYLVFEQFIFFLIIFFIPSQLGKHFWPDFAALFSIRTDYFSPTLYFWDLLLLILGSSLFVKWRQINRLAVSVFLLFFLSQLFSLFSAANFGAGVVRLEQYLLMGILGIYISSRSLQLLAKPLYLGLIGGVTYSSLIAIAQVFTGGTLGLWFLGERSFRLDSLSIATFDWYGQVFLRAYATFPHPNVLAAFIFVAISLILYIREEKSLVRSRHFEWSAIMLGSIGLLLTFSRVGLVVYGLVFGFLLRERVKLLGIIFLLLLPFLYVRFNSAFNFDQLSFIRREELAIHAISLFSKEPLFGVGLNNFIYELAYGAVVSGENRFLQPVHSIYLLTLAETGIIGFAGFLVLLVIPIVRVFKRRLWILFWLWMGILGMGFFDHYFLTLAQGQRVLFLVWGISMLEYGNERRDAKSRQSNRLATGR